MRGGVGCSAFRRSQILSCWRHHALRAPVMGCSPPSRHSYRPRTIRSTVAAPMAMARFRPPPRARFPRSTYAVVVRVFRALRLRTSSYPVCGASLFLFSLLWLSGLVSFPGPHPSLSLVELLAPAALLLLLPSAAPRVLPPVSRGRPTRSVVSSSCSRARFRPFPVRMPCVLPLALARAPVLICIRVPVR